MKLILAVLLAFSLNSTSSFAQTKKVVNINGSIVDSQTRLAKPLKFAKVKLCSTTRNITCNEYLSNEKGKFFAMELENDKYNIYVNDMLKSSVEVQTKDVDVPTIIVPGGATKPRNAPKTAR